MSRLYHPYYTRDEDVIIVRMRREHKTYQEIAQVIGRSAASVSRHAQLLGLSKRIRALDDDDKEFIRLYGKEKSASWIAKKLNCTLQTVRNYLIQYGYLLPSNRRGPRPHV